MNAGHPRRWLLASLLAACDAGPTLYLGIARQGDASEAGPADAGTDGARDADSGDDDEVSCAVPSDCTALEKYPYCHAERAVCVTCLSDDDCDPDEHCDLDEGDCDDNR